MILDSGYTGLLFRLPCIQGGPKK